MSLCRACLCLYLVLDISLGVGHQVPHSHAPGLCVLFLYLRQSLTKLPKLGFNLLYSPAGLELATFLPQTPQWLALQGCGTWLHFLLSPSQQNFTTLAGLSTPYVDHAGFKLAEDLLPLPALLEFVAPQPAVPFCYLLGTSNT